MVVCPAENGVHANGVRANGVSILTGTMKLLFSYIHSSVMSDPNGTKFTVEFASMQVRPHFT